MRNGWTYFWIRSRISFLAIAQPPFAESQSSPGYSKVPRVFGRSVELCVPAISSDRCRCEQKRAPSCRSEARLTSSPRTVKSRPSRPDYRAPGSAFPSIAKRIAVLGQSDSGARLREGGKHGEKREES